MPSKRTRPHASPAVKPETITPALDQPAAGSSTTANGPTSKEPRVEPSAPSYVGAGGRSIKVHLKTDHRWDPAVARLKKRHLEAFVSRLAQTMPESIPTMLSLMDRVIARPARRVQMKSCNMHTKWIILAKEGAPPSSVKKIGDRIEADLKTEVKYALEYIQDKTNEHEASIQTWKQAIRNHYQIWLCMISRNSLRFGLSQELFNLGAVKIMADGVTTLIPVMMVFEYNQNRDRDAKEIRNEIESMTELCHTYQVRVGTKLLSFFDETRERWRKACTN